MASMRQMRASTADGFLEVDGARLRYRDEGDGFPLLLIHGWALDLEMWQPQVDAWRERLRVIRYDRRGFGASSGRPSLDLDVCDAESLLRRLNVSRVAVVGMSQGARTALKLAAGPMRSHVACLVLDGAPFETGQDEESEVPLERYREIARQQGLEAFRAEWLAHPFTQLRTTDAGARESLSRMTARYPAHDLRFPGHAQLAEPPLAEVTVATLVINGELDTPRRREMGDELARALPRAERTIVPGAGHLPNLDNPSRYNERILSFIERSTGDGRSGGHDA